MTIKTRSIKPLLAALSLAWGTAALADINIGVSVSATGPAAVLGGPQKNTNELFPSSIAGEKINWIVLDDGSDPTNTAKNVAKLLNENKVDILMAGTTTLHEGTGHQGAASVVRLVARKSAP